MTCGPYPFPPTFCGLAQFPPCNPFTYPHVLEQFTVPASGSTVDVKVSHTQGLWVGQGVQILNQYYIITAIDVNTQTITVELTGTKSDSVVSAIHPSYACYMTPVIPAGLVTKTLSTFTVAGYNRSGLSTVASSVTTIADRKIRYGWLGPDTLYVRGHITCTIANSPYWIGITMPSGITAEARYDYSWLGSASYWDGTDQKPLIMLDMQGNILMIGPGSGTALTNASGRTYQFGAIIQKTRY